MTLYHAENKLNSNEIISRREQVPMRLYHAENKLNSNEIISRREQAKFQ